MVDLSRDQHGRVHARLLDLVPGRSGKAYADWLTARGDAFRERVQVATLDPFHGYKNAIDDHLEDATAVLDAFHVVKLGTDAVDQVRRRRTPRRGLLRLVLRPTTQRGLPPPRPRRRQEHRGADHQVAPDLPDPRDLAPQPDPQAVARGVSGLLHHQPIQQRRHRSHQRPDRALPPRRPRLQRPRQLPPTHRCSSSVADSPAPSPIKRSPPNH